MKSKLITKLTKMMNKKLPGKSSHEEMMVRPKQKFPKKKSTSRAAVLILLYPLNNNWYFYLTKRTKTVEHHKGQVSLPGGMLEKGESSQRAAIRETYEELGIKPQGINTVAINPNIHPNYPDDSVDAMKIKIENLRTLRLI